MRVIFDSIERAALYETMHPGFSKAFAFIQAFEGAPLAPGKYEIDGDNVFALVQSYETKGPEGRKLEAHRAYIDVQYLSGGVERIGYAPLERTTLTDPYDPEKDCSLHAAERIDWLSLRSGSFSVFFPGDAHMPCVSDGADSGVVKIVVKIVVKARV